MEREIGGSDTYSGDDHQPDLYLPAGRETLSISLNFMLPVEHLSGPLRLEMRVWLAQPPHGVVDGPHTNDVSFLNLNFEATNHVRIVQVLI